MLVGLIKPTSGRVTICGHDVRHDFEAPCAASAASSRNPDLYRFMTGRENLEHFARMLARRATEIERVAELVSLAHRLDQRVGTYSLGMRQRLGIAQALLGDPKLLILDEPANGLDPAGIREIRELLRRLARERQMSVFVSSHLLAEIELTCDRVAIIHKGRILREGTVRELISSRREMELRVDDVKRAAEIIGNATIDRRPAARPDRRIRRAAARRRAHARPASTSTAWPQTGRHWKRCFLEATGGETVD
jgi:ABC-2 type transport system ATP-binding protein